MGFDSPMCFLTEVPHNIHCKFVVWNVYSFTIFTSNDCWWPPANMLHSKKTSMPNSEISKSLHRIIWFLSVSYYISKTWYIFNIWFPHSIVKKCNLTHLNSARNLISFNLRLNPFIYHKRPSSMNHRAWKEVCKYLNQWYLM